MYSEYEYQMKVTLSTKEMKKMPQCNRQSNYFEISCFNK